MFIWNRDPVGFSEQEYNEDYFKQARRSFLVATSFGLLIYNAFALLDYFERPDLFTQHTLIRFAMVTPAVLWLARRSRSLSLRQYLRQIVMICALLISVSVIFFHWNRNHMASATEPVGLVFVIMYCLTALRMMRREALIYSAVVILAVTFGLSLANAGSSAWFSYLFSSIVACGLGTAVAQLIENSWRKNFVQKKFIERQEAQAAALLEMVFPVSIAERLKTKHDSIAEYAANVSVLFADIKGFTSLSQSMKPGDLVAALDAIFSRLDQLCSFYGCEKIKTVGDAYMAVSGVPLPAGDHAERLVRLALAMQEESANLTLAGKPVTFRIGIHSGPVVAGVIGKSRFSYDLWGDTVNTASRLESTAPSGGIQISEETARLVSHHFELVSRGKTMMKGKGERNTWLVTGHKHASRETESRLLITI